MKKRNKQEPNSPIISQAPTSQGIHFFEETNNPYAQQVDRRHKVEPRAQKIFVLAVILVAVYCIGVIVPKNVFSDVANFNAHDGGTFAYVVRQFSTNMEGVVLLLSGDDGFRATGTLSMMLRFVVMMFAGAGLALSGAVYQGTFKNPLVAPSTLGVMSGATLGLAFWIAVFVGDEGGLIVPWTGEYYLMANESNTLLENFWGSTSLALCSFAGCLIVVGIVLLVMKLAGRGNPSPLLIVILGQILGGISGAIVSAIRYYYVTLDPYGVKADLFTYTTIATFYRSFTWFDVISVGVPLVLVFVAIMTLRNKMQLLAFSQEEARTMGVNSRRLRVVVIALVTLLTAIIVSFCGAVGYVGFLIPHLARRFVGPDFKYLLPACMLMGALFILGSYVLLWVTIGDAYTDMLGMYITMGGTVVFLATVLRGGGRDIGRFR